jgi:N-acyl-D-amino-acid deacylase
MDGIITESRNRSREAPMFTFPLRAAIHAAACVALLGTAPSRGSAQAVPTTLIRNALIIDGRGTPGRRGDVRVSGNRIVGVGTLAPLASDRIVDAHGLALAPGFIDTHSHHDRGLITGRGGRGNNRGGDTTNRVDPRAGLAMVSQGVTTIVIGQDGGGSGLAELFAAIEAQPPAVNVASYVGHGAVRSRVLGEDFKRHATPDEIERMKALVREDMNAGALGLSTGLEYDPGIYSSPDEVIALAKVAGDMGGRYISHMRSEDRWFWSALDEVITIGRVNHMPVQVSHIKLGMVDLWGQADSVIHVLDRARASGVQITADIYPYTFWQSNLGVLFPKRNFSDSVEAAFVLAHVSRADGIIFNSFARHPEYVGKNLAEVARMRGTSDVRALLDLLAEPGGSGAGIVARGMDDADVERLIRWPFANVCSDGTSTGLHPRGFGSFSRVLGPYAREKKLFSTEEAVRKMSSLAAANVGIRERGLIEPGYYADLVLFDPGTVKDNAEFGPTGAAQRLASGIQTVWVNGQVVFADGKPSGAYPGKVIRRERSSR